MWVSPLPFATSLLPLLRLLCRLGLHDRHMSMQQQRGT